MAVICHLLRLSAARIHQQFLGGARANATHPLCFWDPGVTVRAPARGNSTRGPAGPTAGTLPWPRAYVLLSAHLAGQQVLGVSVATVLGDRAVREAGRQGKMSRSYDSLL